MVVIFLFFREPPCPRDDSIVSSIAVIFIDGRVAHLSFFCFLGLTMSSLSPARHLQTKTSDLTEFFGGNGNFSNQPRRSRKDATTSKNLEVPFDDETASIKKKITRIPLFGRSRKKSNQSTSSSPFGTFVCDSSDLGEPSSASRALSADTRCAGFFFPFHSLFRTNVLI